MENLTIEKFHLAGIRWEGEVALQIASSHFLKRSLSLNLIDASGSS